MPDPPPGRINTSKKAAARKRGIVERDREAILRLAWDRYLTGVTQDEACIALNLRTQSASARFCELRDAGYLERLSRTRPTRTGSPARVHTITVAGIMLLKQLDAERNTARVA